MIVQQYNIVYVLQYYVTIQYNTMTVMCSGSGSVGWLALVG